MFVLQKLAGCSVNQLPSGDFLSNLYAASKIIASKQVVESMLPGLDLSDHLGNSSLGRYIKMPCTLSLCNKCLLFVLVYLQICAIHCWP